MNKINIYVLTFFLSLAGVSIYAQNNRSQVVITSGQDNNKLFTQSLPCTGLRPMIFTG